MNKDKAIEIARYESKSRGWPFVEPIKVSARRKFTLFGSKQWHVMTQADRKGGNVNIWIDNETGKIISAGFAKQ